MRRRGKDPDYAVNTPENWDMPSSQKLLLTLVMTFLPPGVGSNQYLAINQGQHDIHCLDQLRKFAYVDYYYGNNTNELELDALRCLHTILQTLQCQNSVNLYTAFWVEDFDNPAVDFNTSRNAKFMRILCLGIPKDHIQKSNSSPYGRQLAPRGSS